MDIVGLLPVVRICWIEVIWVQSALGSMRMGLDERLTAQEDLYM